MNGPKLLIAVVSAGVAGSAYAQNIALNKPVSITVGSGSILTPAPSPNVITDGVFLGEATPYSNPAAINGSIRWNTGLAGPTTIEIQLGDPYRIDGIIAQADDNDALVVSYLTESNTFEPLYTVANISVGFGFRTRPNANQTTYADLTPVVTTAIRVVHAGGDGFYGLSELQLRGELVTPPCPADLTTGAVVGQPGYGVPNGVVTNDDFFYFLAQFAAGNLAVCDLTTGAVSGQPGYGVPNGAITNDDFFYYLTIFAAGC
ncbi:MAG: GC-type dockerin domain-anchored protein [Phycisphaerales bacterium]